MSREGEPVAVFGSVGTGAATSSLFGSLEPGRYTLNLATVQEVEVAASAGFARGAFNFTFDMSPVDAAPVPEPTSLLLLGTGLAGVFGWRKRLRIR